MNPTQDPNPRHDAEAPAGSAVQGEGDYEAARRYRKSVSDFANSGQVDGAARRAAPKTAEEQAEMEAAEREGLRHSKAEGK
jgi:hypothetical protein